jgi:endoglucanase
MGENRVSAGNTDLVSLTDPENKIIYEMHQYLDSDGSGTSATCVSTTIGSSRLEAATAWLKSAGKVGILGERIVLVRVLWRIC